MRRLLRWYGASPLHLLAFLGCFAVAGYAAARLVPSRPLGVAVWFVGAVIGHDLLLVPLYSLADSSAAAAIRHRAPQLPALPWINYLRVPAGLSGLLLLVWFPLILRLRTRYQASTTLSPAPFLWHWLAVTGALFLLSAIALAWRIRALPRPTDLPEQQPAPSPAAGQGHCAPPRNGPLPQQTMRGTDRRTKEHPMTSTGPRYDDLSALFFNCTLKPSPQLSHTQGLIDRSAAIMAAHGVRTETIRAIDHDIATGVWPDMTEHGAATDAWPQLYEKVLAADILIIAGPIWLGDNSSVTKRVTERLYACSHLLNDAGQYAYYGRVAGCLITGNEDGVKHCAMNILYSLQHLGYAIPPQADAGWIGEAGPGPSYLDPGSGGPGNDFTNRNTTFMTWNLLHLARLLKDAGGIPAHGNQRSGWDAGCRYDYPNPEYR
jgi:multimeric flavodoxin WrbA